MVLLENFKDFLKTEIAEHELKNLKCWILHVSCRAGLGRPVSKPHFNEQFININFF